MRLHRAISSDLPVLVVALEEEATHLHVTELPVLVTGVGKVNAAVAVATILGEFSPARVINLGTAGGLRDGLWGTQVISRVTQHDLDDSALFALTGLHFGAPIEFGGTGPTLTTGDAFISDSATRERLAQQADLVDMEAYAIAHAAAVAGIPLTIVKQVSDQAGETASKSWASLVDECAQQLGIWVRDNVLK